MKELEEVLKSVKDLLKRLKMVEIALSSSDLKSKEKREIIQQNLSNFTVDYFEFLHKLIKFFDKYNNEKE